MPPRRRRDEDDDESDSIIDNASGSEFERDEAVEQQTAADEDADLRRALALSAAEALRPAAPPASAQQFIQRKPAVKADAILISDDDEEMPTKPAAAAAPTSRASSNAKPHVKREPSTVRMEIDDDDDDFESAKPTPSKRRRTGVKQESAEPAKTSSPHFTPVTAPSIDAAAASSTRKPAVRVKREPSNTKVKKEPVRRKSSVKREVASDDDDSDTSDDPTSESDDASRSVTEDELEEDTKPKKKQKSGTTPKKRAPSNGAAAATATSDTGTVPKKVKRQRKPEFTYDEMEDFFVSQDKEKKGYLSLGNLVSVAGEIQEEFKSEDLEAMIAEANKTGPRNMLGQPMQRVYLADFLNMMRVCGLIPEKDERN